MRNLSSLRPKTIKGGKKLKLGVWFGVGGAGAPLGPIVGWGCDPRPFRGSEIVGADRWWLERESRSEEKIGGGESGGWHSRQKLVQSGNYPHEGPGLGV